MSYGDWRKEAGLREQVAGAASNIGIKPALAGDISRVAKWTWRNKIPLAATAAIGATVVRGARDAREQEARMQDHMNRMRHDLTSTMPSMEVRASYEKLAREKLASGGPPSSFGERFGTAATNAGAKAIADALVDRFLVSPMDAAYGGLKRRFSDEPAWKKNFEHVVGSDPLLAQAHNENPTVLADAFDSIKRFSPTLAKDRLATRNVLKHVVLSGGEMDHSVMKMLAETEKLHAESKKR